MSKLTYIAGPFFTDAQKAVIENIEDYLDIYLTSDEQYFSPREYGIISGGEMNPARTKRIFDMNIRMIKEADRMIAVTDDFDPGTMFEIGAFFTENNGNSIYGDDEHDTPLITYSPMGYKANVMIAYATFTHVRDLDELGLAIKGHDIDTWETEE